MNSKLNGSVLGRGNYSIKMAPGGDEETMRLGKGYGNSKSARAEDEYEDTYG